MRAPAGVLHGLHQCAVEFPGRRARGPGSCCTHPTTVLRHRMATREPPSLDGLREAVQLRRSATPPRPAIAGFRRHEPAWTPAVVAHLLGNGGGRPRKFSMRAGVEGEQPASHSYVAHSAHEAILHRIQASVSDLLSHDLEGEAGLTLPKLTVSEATVDSSEQVRARCRCRDHLRSSQQQMLSHRGCLQGARWRRALTKYRAHKTLVGMLSEAQGVDRQELDRVRAELRLSSSDGLHVTKEDFYKHFDKHDPLVKEQIWNHAKREDAAGTGNRERVVSTATIDSVSRLWAKTTNNVHSHQVDLLCQLLDVDNDGRVSHEEFVHFLAQASGGNLEVLPLLAPPASPWVGECMGGVGTWAEAHHDHCCIADRADRRGTLPVGSG